MYYNNAIISKLCAKLVYIVINHYICSSNDWPEKGKETLYKHCTELSGYIIYIDHQDESKQLIGIQSQRLHLIDYRHTHTHTHSSVVYAIIWKILPRISSFKQ